MKQIFLLCIILLAAFGPATAQKTGEKCKDIPYVPLTLNPNPTNVPPSLNPPTPPETTPPIEGYRGIYWVHGLGGDTDSWAKAYTATDGGDPTAGFPARKTKSVGLTYSPAGLPQSGQTLLDNIYLNHSLIATLVDDFSKNYIIAHSQGGFVSRKADKLLILNPAQRQHYGIVTFGSPHQGAKIINSRNKGDIANWLADGCSFRLNAAVNEFIADRPILALFVNTNQITQQLGNVCDFTVNDILPFALNGLFTETSNSYATDAPEITELNAYNNPNTRKVAFYGVEYNTITDPYNSNYDPTDNQYVAKQAVWRLASSKLANVSSLPPFTADGDQDMVDKANQITMELYGKYQEAMEDGFNAPCYFGLFDCPGPYFDAAAAYYRAYQWFDGADYVWKFMTGHRSYGVNPNGTGYCNGGPSNLDSYTMTQTQCGIAQGIWYPNTVLMVKPSDGVVLAESAKNFPGAAVGKALEGSNHFQMRNDSQLKIALNGLYNGGNGIWFRTDPQ